MSRAIAAGVSFVLAALSGVIAAVVAVNDTLGLWLALGVVVVVGAVLQGIVTIAEPRPKVVASGAGSVAVGGTARQVSTHVRGTVGTARQTPGKVTASGPGAVSIGGNATDQIETDTISGQGPEAS